MYYSNYLVNTRYHRNVGTKADNKSWLPKDAKRPQVTNGGLTPKNSLLIMAVALDGEFYCQVLPQNITLNSECYNIFSVVGEGMAEINQKSYYISLNAPTV